MYIALILIISSTTTDLMYRRNLFSNIWKITKNVTKQSQMNH